MKNSAILVSLLLLAVLLVYAGHFHNGFHFDDLHTVVQNPYIRDLHNIPRFFTDGRTFSIKPSNRTYRPLVSASLAIDYWLSGGLNPFWFHVSTFCWYLFQLVLMFTLFRRIFDLARPDPRNTAAAILAAAWYGLHPAMAETVNYVIQRGDLYSTLGVIGGIVLYAAAPKLRKFGLYLIPLALAVLSKAPALIFPVILFAYIRLFEEEPGPRGTGRSMLRSIPAVVATVGLIVFTKAMTPKEYIGGAPSAFLYRITQPLIALRYFRTFFLPGNLTADTDMSAVSSVWSSGAWAGSIFIALLIAAAWFCASKRQWRPVSFGIWWFLLALLPTSVYPLGEVENDHRMFFPFVGLVLAASWTIALWIYNRPPMRSAVKAGLAIACGLELMVLSLGAMDRNRVWRSEESLWQDVTIKSPGNARGLMNYGSILAEKGEAHRALVYLEMARRQDPNYGLIELNLGFANAKLARDEEAEEHYLRGLKLVPYEPRGYFLYAGWLDEHGREQEAIDQLRAAVKVNPDFLDSVYLLMKIEARRGAWEVVARLADYVLKRFPTDPNARAYLLMAATEKGKLESQVQPVEPLKTAENYVNLSVLYYQSEKFDSAIRASREALKLQPSYAEAYNNLSAASLRLGRWGDAAEASRAALRLRPAYPSAERNLALAESKLRNSQ